MSIHFPWRTIFCVLLVSLLAKGSDGRKIYDGFQESSSRDNHLALIKNSNDHSSMHMDPSSNVFFTINDLKIGKTIPIYFPSKDPSNSPHLLSRKEANSIPLSFSKLSYLLQLFSFTKESKQAKGMEYTLKQCEAKSIQGETKTCATSLESMLDFVQTSFGLNTKFKVLTTNYLKTPVGKLQNYTILEEPREVKGTKFIGCHVMPFPFVVYYCHTREGGNRVFEMLLGDENGGDNRVEAAGMCHMDTSQWDKDHIAFHLLKIRPGSGPVCHFFQADSLVWVPV
ncbi:BURP domain protein USPL1-like [Mercurialis annua]|uniref:BURP domain protein USPL1-like n=1 Tax=Mercurialis annua TaxID=3986 RepID=UPI002160CADC|nr:BURP domain protein USPL1-like [Mercurialis annua]XP_050235272.1 BURP domain protein USPL1-like [Mercurialis annua]